MKVVYVYDHVVEVCQGRLYSNALRTFVKRYAYLGDVTACVCRKDVDRPSMNEVKLPSEHVVFIQKENRLKTLVATRKSNRQILERHIAEAGLVITHLPTSVGFLAMKLARKMGKPTLVAVVGCPWDALSNSKLPRKLCAPLFYLALRYWVKRADFVIYVTQEFLQRRYPAPGKETLACSNVALPPIDESVLQRRLNRIDALTPGEPLKLVTCGGLFVHYKGQQDVIRAMAELKKRGILFHYYVLGLGSGERLIRLAEQLGVTDQFHVLGSKTSAEVIATLDQMDLYVQPSYTEGLPRSVVEAMSRALPCLGTTAGGIPELLPQQDLFPPKDVRALIRQLTDLTPERMHRMAERNFTRAKDYAAETLQAKRMAFFNRILNMCKERGENPNLPDF